MKLISNNTAAVDWLNNIHCNKSDNCDQRQRFNICITAAYISGKEILAILGKVLQKVISDKCTGIAIDKNSLTQS